MGLNKKHIPSLCNRSRKKPRGMVLISMLGVLSITIVVLAGISIKTQQNSNKTTTYLNRIQAKQHAFAAERYALQKIVEEEKKKSNIGTLKIENFPYSITSGHVTMDIVDQNSLFNLNWLLEDKSSNKTNKNNLQSSALNILRSLLSVLSIDTMVADQLNEIVNRQSQIKIMPNNLNNTPTNINREIFSISCINLLENISLEDKQKLSTLVTVLPKESLLNINIANKTILMAIDNLLRINFADIIENKQPNPLKSWPELEKLFVDFAETSFFENVKKLPIGFHSNFISLYIKSTKGEYNFFLKSVIYYLKANQPKVVTREIGPNYQWLFIDKE